MEIYDLTKTRNELCYGVFVDAKSLLKDLKEGLSQAELKEILETALQE